VHIKEAFRLETVEAARTLVRAHPFATIVTRDLLATHMPCLVDEQAEGLTLLGHVAHADPASRTLDGPVLLIFHGPHGYVSASWYGDETIPTWNHVTLHVRGTPHLLSDAMPVLRRTVDHFEAAVERPWSLDRMGNTAREMADQVVAFRLHADWWHAEAKLSQDKPAEEQARVLAGLEGPGPTPTRRSPRPCVTRSASARRRRRRTAAAACCGRNTERSNDVGFGKESGRRAGYDFEGWF
jgi:transcriptional regulator